MGDEYPLFHTVSQLTNGFLLSMLKVYHDEMTKATDTDSLFNWIQAVIPEVAISDMIGSDDLEEIKVEFLKDLGNQLIAVAMTNTRLADSQMLTPWDIAKSRNEILTRLFGPTYDKIDVIVTVGPNIYHHNLPEELTCGLVIGLTNYPIALSVGDIQLKYEYFQNKYSHSNSHMYSVIFKDNEHIYFDTTEFIQGIKTAAAWSNQDSHTLVKDLLDIKSNIQLMF